MNLISYCFFKAGKFIEFITFSLTIKKPPDKRELLFF